ncbi:hypothetical protein B0H13DRAFT_1855179 [Mycena leptocephala]|nr:hypothetical protein B0H13DRAFT_1855179 [Mycena leptocephala]
MWSARSTSESASGERGLLQGYESRFRGYEAKISKTHSEVRGFEADLGLKAHQKSTKFMDIGATSNDLRTGVRVRQIQNIQIVYPDMEPLISKATKIVSGTTLDAFGAWFHATGEATSGQLNWCFFPSWLTVLASGQSKNTGWVLRSMQGSLESLFSEIRCRGSPPLKVKIPGATATEAGTKKSLKLKIAENYYI